MPRAIWKGPFIDWYVIKKVQAVIKGDKLQPIRLWSRRSTILKEFVGLKFEVHNGKSFIPLEVKQEMVGHKFGEFSPTRKRPVHPVKVISMLPKKKNPMLK